MRLEPQDLGTRWHVFLVRERTRSWWSRLTKKDAPEPRLGFLGRLWNRRLKIDPEAAAATFPYAADETLGATYGLGATLATVGASVAAALALGSPDIATVAHSVGMAAAVGVGAAGGWVGAVALPRAVLRKLHRRPLSRDEIEDVLGMESEGPFLHRLAAHLMERFGAAAPEASDPLERAFLQLVLEALRRDIPAEAEEDIRVALRALGDAISDLPQPLETSDEMIALRQKAAAFTSRAQQEPDRVVAASFERQAEALRRQADAVEETNRLARRIQVLRQEMATQIAALRSGLAVFGACGTDDVQVLIRCAEAVRGIATEAASVARARDELNGVLHRTPQATIPVVQVGQNRG